MIAILDDGNGMSEKELRESMRLGSVSPSEDREAGDLGRFFTTIVVFIGLGIIAVPTGLFANSLNYTYSKRRDK